jgi:hypothetical protein
MSDLIKELEAVINKHSIENESDTPDFLLATYLSGCLENYAKVVKARDDWYGFKPFDESTTTSVEGSNK